MEQNNNQIAVRPVQKTAVMIRREMVNIPAVMDALGPVERAVFLASTAETVLFRFDVEGFPNGFRNEHYRRIG